MRFKWEFTRTSQLLPPPLPKIKLNVKELIDYSPTSSRFFGFNEDNESGFLAFFGGTLRFPRMKSVVVYQLLL